MSDPRIIPPDQWRQLHGDTPLCRICGWAPERTLAHICMQCSALFSYLNFGCVTLWGIFPDYMHIVHLALAMDSISSVLLDLTDPGIIAGASRDARLNHLWLSYREWAEGSRHLPSKFFCAPSSVYRPYFKNKWCCFSIYPIRLLDIVMERMRSTRSSCETFLHHRYTTTGQWRKVLWGVSKDSFCNRMSVLDLLALQPAAYNKHQWSPWNAPRLIQVLIFCCRSRCKDKWTLFHMYAYCKTTKIFVYIYFLLQASLRIDWWPG